MTDSMNRLVDFLTVPQDSIPESGLLDANKVSIECPQCGCKQRMVNALLFMRISLHGITIL